MCHRESRQNTYRDRTDEKANRDCVTRNSCGYCRTQFRRHTAITLNLAIPAIMVPVFRRVMYVEVRSQGVQLWLHGIGKRVRPITGLGARCTIFKLRRTSRRFCFQVVFLMMLFVTRNIHLSSKDGNPRIQYKR